jgi:hypothetical protein
LESFNFIGIAGSRFHGLAGRAMADCSDAREQRMSGGLTSATRRQKKFSYLAASPSKSGKNEIRIGCRTLMTIYPFGTSEAGRNIAEHQQKGVACFVPDDEQGQYEGLRKAKERKQHQPPNPQPSLLGLVKIRRALPLEALR